MSAARRQNEATNDIAALKGKRLVSIVETDAEASLNETLIKQLTGRDTLSARFLYREFFDPNGSKLLV